ncbi:MAG: hypothetical protein ACK5P5_04275 [Pseudobdellovibrionaceae bacterium]
MLNDLFKIGGKSRFERILMILVATMSIGPDAFSHGEDKPGPNGGFIKMPGAFHTEVVLESKNSLKVFLLDMQWKNPSVVNSSVEVLAITKDQKSTIQANCTQKATFHLCKFSKDTDLKKKGSLTVKAKREGAVGNSVDYDLPLRLPMPANTDQHEGHH